MAVYTALGRDALTPWLATREVGTLVDFRGIESGIENSNYFVTTTDRGRERRFVLTLFERLGDDELPYYLSLMEHLATHSIACPAPMPGRDGRLHASLAGKPAALVTRLEGRSVRRPTPDQCAAIGTELARLHRAGAAFAGHQPNPRGLDWWIVTAATVRPFLDDGQRLLLDDEVALQATRWRATTASLPRGPIHADLFRDNVLFGPATDGHEADASSVVGGIIDFYFAGDDVWIFDVAVCLNDWCVDEALGTFDEARRRAFVDAYERVRPLEAAERAALPLVLRAAALRFWLSRVDDLHRPRPAEMLKPHDPAQFERLLRARRAEAIAATPAPRPGTRADP